MLRVLKIMTLIVTISTLSVACGGPENEGSTNTKTQLEPVLNDPSEFLPFLRWVIEADRLELLQELCHPDPSRIYSEGTVAFCNIASEGPDRIEKFKNWFGTCSQEGEITIEKDMAYVRATIANGEMHSVHFLEKKDDVWYVVNLSVKQ